MFLLTNCVICKSPRSFILFTYCLYNTSIFYSLVIGPIFRLYVSFLSLKICHYCLLMFLIVYDVSFNVLKHYTSLIEV